MPAKFLFALFIFSVIFWLLFILVAWILSQIVGASIGFQFAGWKCLRDVVVKFRKGAVQSISIGEIRLGLRQSLAKQGVGFISREPKLQILLCGLEIVLRPSTKRKKKARTHRVRSRTSGLGKWAVLANISRFLSVSLTDFVVKTPKFKVELKELKLDISKCGGSKSNVFVKLDILPIVVHIGDPLVGYDQSSNCMDRGCIVMGEIPLGTTERSLAPFSCDEISLSCEFAHDSEIGVMIPKLDITIGEVTMNLNEKLLSKKKTKSDSSSQPDEGPSDDSMVAKALEKEESTLGTITKYTSVFPEKVCFTWLAINVRFVHQECNLALENNIKGFQLKSIKSRSIEDVGESTRLDLQMDCSEIHLLRETGTSIVEIMKVDIVSFIYIPVQGQVESNDQFFRVSPLIHDHFTSQPTSTIKAEIDVKLGGSQCNVIISRLKPWLSLHKSKQKKMLLREEKPTPIKAQLSSSKTIMWTCTVSAPEMTVVLYTISGLPLYHGCSRSSHFFANNMSTLGPTVHMDLGELNLRMGDENQECLKENLFGMNSYSGALLHIAKVRLDWGKKEIDGTGENAAKNKMVLSIDVMGMGVYLNLKQVESFVVTAISFQQLLKSLSTSTKRTSNSRDGRSSKSSGNDSQLLKFSLKQCSVILCGHTGLDNTVVADPKRVNYGSQGGQIVISVSADGTPRCATVMSTVSDDCKKLKYSISLDITLLTLSLDKKKQSLEMELERATSIYQEYLEKNKFDTKFTLFDIENSKFVRRSGGLKGISVCSLFRAANITARWDPDLHLSVIEVALQLKLLVHNQKLLFQEKSNEYQEDASGLNEAALESGNLDKPKKKESVFAVDVEMLTISAGVGDGVDAVVQVQSIFSENACIGVLLEGLILSFNNARVFKSSRMQVSRIPSASSGCPDAKVTAAVTWDWVIQGLDVYICLPYRLELRAIDDSVEEMLRGLKLITAAKTKLIFPTKNESSKPSKSHKPSMPKFRRVKFCIHKLTVDIEEEPLQGWLDEHYQLLKKVVCERAVRLNFLDNFIAKRTQEVAETNDSSLGTKIIYDGLEIDLQDPSIVEKMKEDIYRQSFRSYYQVCQKLIPSEGSGACTDGFQAGFKPSIVRTSLLSVSATDLDVTLAKIDGGEAGMIDVLKSLDPVCLENDIPFSRLYGSNILLRAGILLVQLRDYTFPLFVGTSGKCEGRVILAQQATYFQPQIQQDVFVGRWRKVRMLRSASGTTPPMKTYFDLPLHFQKAEVSFGVGYEPVFADVSYAFTVALRRANLSVRNPGPFVPPPKKERSLPWWDDMRNYIHGKISFFFSETRWIVHATTDPYEKLDKLQIVSGYMEIQQSDGRVYLSAKDFKILMSSLESMACRCGLKPPTVVTGAFLKSPVFTLEILMDWGCDSGTPLNHYLYTLPIEGKHREKVLDPFRSTSLSFRWNFSLRPLIPSSENQLPSSPMMHGTEAHVPPTINFGAHDLAWAIKFWNLNFLPPHKLRMFSRWPRFGVPRVVRSGNLSLDRVMTEFFLRIDSMPTCIKNVPLHDDDPAKGLTFNMMKLKYELCFSRGKQKYTFECKRELLDIVYQGLDLHMPSVFIDKDVTNVAKVVQITGKSAQSLAVDRNSVDKLKITGSYEKHRDDGFFLSCDYFTIRKQAPKADPESLLAWQEAGRRNLETSYVRLEFENGSESDDHTRSDHSDDDGYNIVIADNCQRVFVYGLKLLWTIENRDAVWSWVGGLSKAFEPPKPSPSRLYTQRKLIEDNQLNAEAKIVQDNALKADSSSHTRDSLAQNVKTSGTDTSLSDPVKAEKSSTTAVEINGSMADSDKEGTRHFMVNVIEPQFNLHSEEANGRFLLAAVCGRVLARSLHSILRVGCDMIEQALGNQNVLLFEAVPEMTWNRMELSVMLEHVQAHVAPTDVDPGAGVQWLPKILRSSPKVKRTGALLERVFMPCDMYFRYTRHKGGTSDMKVKPLKELTFNSHNITATMTSRQFQVMLDVLTNLLFARAPKPRQSSLLYPAEDDEDVEEEADEVVPDGVEEVELAKVNLENKQREVKVLLHDIKKLSLNCDTSGNVSTWKEGEVWMITGGRSHLVQGLKIEFANAKKHRKAASSSLRMALQKAAQLRLFEKEKNKSPSYAMRISTRIKKVGWSMLVDGKSFAEAEINDMIFDFDRDYKDVGVALFTITSLFIRNCLPNAKSDVVLSPWNPPIDWGKKVMLHVDAKQAAPKDGVSRIELFQVEIYPLKICLIETMYKMMWAYFFPEEEQDSQRRQEVWRVSTTAGARRAKKVSSNHEASSMSSHTIKEPEIPSRQIGCAGPELRRTSSFDRTWEETVADSVAAELVLQAHSSNISSSRNDPLDSIEHPEESTKSKSKESKPVKSNRSSHDEKKVGKSHEEKRPRKVMEFQNIKISQVEIQLTFQSSKFNFHEFKLLMDTFHRAEFIGSWRRLFSRVRNHVIWGALKSMTGMQGKKFKDKVQSQQEPNASEVPESDPNLSDNDGDQAVKCDQYPNWLKRPTDGAGDGFVTSVRGLFNTQRRKAKAFVLRTMRGEEESDFQGEWSESEADFSPFARQLTITKAKRLIRRHTKKFRTRGQKGLSSQQRDSLPSSPRENKQFESDSSSESSLYEDFCEYAAGSPKLTTTGVNV